MEQFNPYSEWLGIDATNTSPTNFQLLGISESESSPEVIAQAADRALAKVRSCRPGDHAKAWAELLDRLTQVKSNSAVSANQNGSGNLPNSQSSTAPSSPTQSSASENPATSPSHQPDQQPMPQAQADEGQVGSMPSAPTVPTPSATVPSATIPNATSPMNYPSAVPAGAQSPAAPIAHYGHTTTSAGSPSGQQPYTQGNYQQATQPTAVPVVPGQSANAVPAATYTALNNQGPQSQLANAQLPTQQFPTQQVSQPQSPGYPAANVAAHGPPNGQQQYGLPNNATALNQQSLAPNHPQASYGNHPSAAPPLGHTAAPETHAHQMATDPMQPAPMPMQQGPVAHGRPMDPMQPATAQPTAAQQGPAQPTRLEPGTVAGIAAAGATLGTASMASPGVASTAPLSPTSSDPMTPYSETSSNESPSNNSPAKPVARARKNSAMPMMLGIAGGGVLILGGIILAVAMSMSDKTHDNGTEKQVVQTGPETVSPTIDLNQFKNAKSGDTRRKPTKPSVDKPSSSVSKPARPSKRTNNSQSSTTEFVPPPVSNTPRFSSTEEPNPPRISSTNTQVAMASTPSNIPPAPIPDTPSEPEVPVNVQPPTDVPPPEPVPGETNPDTPDTMTTPEIPGTTVMTEPDNVVAPFAGPTVPEGPPPTAAELATLSATLKSVRSALSEQNFAEAENQLKIAKPLSRSVELIAKYDRLEKLTHYAKEFRDAMNRALDDMKAGQSIKIGNLGEAAIVEADREKLIIRMTGRNKTFMVNEFPRILGLTVADRWFDQNDSSTLVFKGAYQMLHPQSTDAHIAEAKSWWEQAAAAGQPVSELLPIFEDSYDF